MSGDLLGVWIVDRLKAKEFRCQPDGLRAGLAMDRGPLGEFRKEALIPTFLQDGAVAENL